MPSMFSIDTNIITDKEAKRILSAADQGKIDSLWSSANIGSAAPNAYFDYFFSGQDIQVYIDGTEDSENFLPINSFSFNITQQKTPVFGFWDYTYSAVMRGTRIIQGQFVIVTRSPDYMRTILERAATARASKGRSYSYFRDLTEDDENIEKYWGKNIDPAIASAGKNIFSVHPPFSFVVVYGIQNISFNPLEPSGDSSYVYDRYESDSPLMLDTNERLVESDPLDQANRIIIDGCEITSMQTGYDSSGMIVAESYSFFGRDIIIPPRK